MQIYEHIQHPCTTLHLTGRAPRPPKAAAAGGMGPAAGTDAAAGAASA